MVPGFGRASGQVEAIALAPLPFVLKAFDGGLPPFFGGFSAYHSCSAQVTIPPMPWSRPHSANRADRLDP